jgi:hypothetical protein
MSIREHSSGPSGLIGAQAARLTGYVLVLLFFALQVSGTGWRITFHGDLSTSSAGELNVWLGHALFLFPGALLIGYGFAPQLGDWIRRTASTIRVSSARHRAFLVIALTILAVASFLIFR